MPTFRVTDPASGRTLRLTGDSAPTEAELEDIFASVKSDAPDAPEQPTPSQPDPFSVASRTATAEGSAAFAEPGKGFIDGPGAGSRFARGLLTNEEPEGLAGAIGRTALPTLGATLAAPLGKGPLSIPAAAAGGAAFEAGRQGLVGVTNYSRDTKAATPGEVALNIGTSGATEGLAQATGLGAVKAAKAVGPSLRKFGAEMIRVANGVKSKYGEAALNGVLKGAPTLEEAGALYDKVFAPLGLKGLADAHKQATGKMLPGPAEWAELAEAAADHAASVVHPSALDPQKLVWGSQAIAKLKELAKFGNPEQLANARALDMAKESIDDALEVAVPGYADARKKYFAAKTREAFSHVLPQNKNTTPNVLRAQAAGYGALGALTGAVNPLFGIPMLAASPMVVGGAIRGGTATGKLLEASMPAISPALRGALQAAGAFAISKPKQERRP